MEVCVKWTEDLVGTERWGLRVTSAVAFFAMVVTSCVAPIASNSQAIPMPINPAGYAFVIWFVIWLFQGTGVLYGLMPGLNAAKLNGIEALDVYAPLGWATLFVWASLELLQKNWPVVSNGLLLVAMSFFLVAYDRITSGQHAIDVSTPLRAVIHDPTDANWHTFGSALFHWSIYYLPTAMNLAWLLLANCINVSSVAIQLGWVSFSSPALPVALIVLADVVALFFAGRQYNDAVIPLVVVWGLSALLVNNKTSPEIITASWVSVGVVGYAALAVLAGAANALRTDPHIQDYFPACKINSGKLLITPN